MSFKPGPRKVCSRGVSPVCPCVSRRACPARPRPSRLRPRWPGTGRSQRRWPPHRRGTRTPSSRARLCGAPLLPVALQVQAYPDDEPPTTIARRHTAGSASATRLSARADTTAPEDQSPPSARRSRPRPAARLSARVDQHDPLTAANHSRDENARPVRAEVAPEPAAERGVSPGDPSGIPAGTARREDHPNRTSPLRVQAGRRRAGGRGASAAGCIIPGVFSAGPAVAHGRGSSPLPLRSRDRGWPRHVLVPSRQLAAGPVPQVVLQRTRPRPHRVAANRARA